MELNTTILARFDYEGELVYKKVNFWEKMYNDPIRVYILRPVEIVFFLCYVPAFIGIFAYIRDRPIK